VQALRNKTGENTTIDDILNGLVPKSAIDGHINDTGGSGNPDDLPNNGNRQAQILGINMSTWVLIGFGLLVLNMFKKDLIPQRNSSRR
jgi:hypothetical protein